MNLMQTERIAILDAFQTTVANGVLEAVTAAHEGKYVTVDEIRQGTHGYDCVVYKHSLNTLIHPESNTFALIKKGLEDMGYSHISLTANAAPYRAAIFYSLEVSKGDYDV